MRNRLSRKILVFHGLVLAWLTLGVVVAPIHAGSITYVTPPGANPGGGVVSAQADFTTGAGTLTITLTDLLANPGNVGQLLSDLSFTLGNGGTLTSSTATSSAQLITVQSDGSSTLGATVATGWVYTPSGTSGLLDVLGGGGAGPAHLIIGPPGGSGYTNAGGSIAGNGAHNPFLNQSAIFTISGSGISAATTVTSATFSFGTTEGALLVPGVSVPEPSSLILCLSGIGLVASIGVYRSRRRGQRADT